MKTIVLLSLLFKLSAPNFSLVSQASTPQLQEVQQQEFPLNGIQDSISKAFDLAFAEKDPSGLDKIKNNLDALSQKRNLRILTYWKAYWGYYKAIYFYANKQEKESEALVDEYIKSLETIENKTAEDYALLALIRGFSIQFKSFIRAPFISSKAASDLKKATELDPENPRVFYVKASSDFYTPKTFGGGKKTEELLTKALALPAQKISNATLPSWGHEEAYEMLLRYYIREGMKEKALKIYSEASTKYPENYNIERMGERIK